MKKILAALICMILIYVAWHTPASYPIKTIPTKKAANAIFVAAVSQDRINNPVPLLRELNLRELDYFDAVDQETNQVCDGYGWGCKHIEAGIVNDKVYLLFTQDLYECYREQDWPNWECRWHN